RGAPAERGKAAGRRRRRARSTRGRDLRKRCAGGSPTRAGPGRSCPGSGGARSRRAGRGGRLAGLRLRFLASVLQLGIFDAGVHHAPQGGAEAVLDRGEIDEGEGGGVELTVVEALLENLVDQLVDLFRSRLLEAARGALDGVGEA